MAGGIPNYLYRVPFFVLRVCFVFASFIRVLGGGGFPARLCILPIFSGICFCVLVLVCLRCFLIFVVFALFFIFLFFLCSVVVVVIPYDVCVGTYLSIHC